MQSPAPAAVVIDWVKRTADSASLEEGVAERHLAEVCTPANFGEWARTFGKKHSTPLWNYLKRGIRNAYTAASWEQKVDGIFTALECTHTSEAIVHQGGQDSSLTDAEIESVARAIVEFYADKVRQGDRLGNRRKALQLLGLDQMSRLLKQQILVTKSGSIEEFVLVKTAPAGIKRPTLSAVAVIVLRSWECRDMEKYFTESRVGSLTSETLYLASALTYRSEWVVLFETPVALRLGRGSVLVESVTGTFSDEWVDVHFKSGPNSAAAVPARVPVRFGRRTFVPKTADHAALVLLDLFFSKEENLGSSRAAGDLAFAERRLRLIGKSASILYRLSTRPQWAISEGTAGRLELKATSLRRAHDVRGHFRTRDGVTYPVKPHRRKSE